MVMMHLFEPEPIQWGFRGDPWVWRAMRDRCPAREPRSSAEAFVLLRRLFVEVVGVALADPDLPQWVHRPEFGHGGMSSGVVSLSAWREHLMPLLEERARAMWP